jgi:hypothetical protein
MPEGPTGQWPRPTVVLLSLQDAGLLVQLFQMEQTLFRPIHYRLTDGTDIKLITRRASRHARELKLTRDPNRVSAEQFFVHRSLESLGL